MVSLSTHRLRTANIVKCLADQSLNCIVNDSKAKDHQINLAITQVFQ